MSFISVNRLLFRLKDALSVDLTFIFFFADTRHVLLSDPDNDGAITGILSVTDFIRVMLRLHKYVPQIVFRLYFTLFSIFFW